MNTGIQDAHNLAWKLALAVRGRAAGDLLESYDAERRPVGEEVVMRTTHRMDDSLADGTVKFDQWMQDSQLQIAYRSSRWVAEDVMPGAMEHGPRPGDRAPEVRGLSREWVADPVRLKEILRGSGHVLLLYMDAHAPAGVYAQCAEMADALQVRFGDEVALYGIVSPAGHPVDHERFPLLTDADGGFQATYDPPAACVYLIRPDGHIGYRSDRIDAERLDVYLQRIFGGA